MSRRRKLTSEERALWDSIARQTLPLNPERRPASMPETPKPPRKTQDAIPGPGPEITGFRIGEKARGGDMNGFGASAGPTDPPPRMDAKSFGRMRKGKLTPEARIDLHGMTVAEAHPALAGFILRCQSEGKRLVLVITGKGQRADDAPLYPARRGILRQQVPQWLKLAPLGGLVLDVTSAHARHGGDGALYVYLRRAR